MAATAVLPEMDDDTRLARQIYIALQKQVSRQFTSYAVDYSGDCSQVDISATIDLRRVAKDVIDSL